MALLDLYIREFRQTSLSFSPWVSYRPPAYRMHRPPLDSFRQLNLLRHLSAGFTGLHTEFGLCMPEYQGRRFRALLLHSTSRIISSQNLLKQRCAPPFQRRTSRTVVVHGFPEIDGVQRLDDVAALFKHLAALHQHRPLRNSFVKIENGDITDNFHFRNWRLLHRHASGVSPYLPACPCSPC